MSGAVREDDAYSHMRRLREDSLIPDPTPNYSLSRPRALKSCGVGGVRALGARNTIYAVNENRVADAIILTPPSRARLSERLKQRAQRSRVHHIVRLIGTTETARATLACSSHRSSYRSSRIGRISSWFARSRCAPRLSRLRLRFRRIPSKPRVRASARPTGSRSRAPISASRGGRPSPPTCTSTRPMGSRFRAPTSAPVSYTHLTLPTKA